MMELDFLADAGHDAVENEGMASSDDNEEQLASLESAPTLVDSATADLRPAERTPTSSHGIGPSKTKRWRANMGGVLPYPHSASMTS